VTIARAEASDQHLDVSAWLVPDPHARARVLPSNFRIFVEYGTEVSAGR
jgi:hypothetical protein